MKIISQSHSAINRTKNISVVKVSKWLKRKRIIRQKISKIRNYIMDAYRNAKDIVSTNIKITALEDKLKSIIEDPREAKVDYALQAITSLCISEVQSKKTINLKLLLLILLWVLDKIVLLVLFYWFSK